MEKLSKQYRELCSKLLAIPSNDEYNHHDEYLLLCENFFEEVMYRTCEIVPHITEKHINNLALGHPVMLWLWDYAERLDNLLNDYAKRYALRYKGLEDALTKLPQSFVRVACTLERCRIFNAFVACNTFHKQHINQALPMNLALTIDPSFKRPLFKEKEKEEQKEEKEKEEQKEEN